MTWFDVLVKVVDRADDVLDKVRKTPRKRLGSVPEPNAPPDPFSTPARAAAQEVEPPLGDPALPAQIFGKRTDTPSALVVQLFREHGIDAKFTNLDDADHQHLEQKLVRETKAYEIPYVFVRGAFVGGFEAVSSLAKSGELASRADAGASPLR